PIARAAQGGLVGFQRPPQGADGGLCEAVVLITPAYLEEQQRLHENARYGAASKKFAAQVAEVIADCRPRTVLDYGAGKRALREALGAELDGIRFVEYDPAIPAIADMPPGTFDLVCCIDVLEHIEPECLADVIAAIRSKAGRLVLATIHTGPAGKTLSDGRNAHLIQQPLGWWVDTL